MRPVSAAFNRIVRGSHSIDVTARVLTTYQEGVSPVGTDLQVIHGEVHMDSTADVRSTLTLEVNGNDMWPLEPTGLLTPYGNEVFVQRGVVVSADGSSELVSLGYFRIYSVDQDGTTDTSITLECRDRMSGIVDARLEAPIQFQSSQSVQDVFTQLVQDVYPTATIVFDFNAAGTLLGADQVADEDRYGFLLDVARSRGKVIYWDYAGRLQVKTAPDPRVPVFDVNAGHNGVLIRLRRTLDRDGVYNAVVALGESPSGDEPVRAVARDLDPTSPTRWGGRFGKVPRFFYSAFMRTVQQASDAAVAMLQRSIGLPYNVDFSAVPNPALEPLDPILVTHEDKSELHVIETLTIPLQQDDPMSGTTRKQTGSVIEVST
jgi:hypothetical protein